MCVRMCMCMRVCVCVIYPNLPLYARCDTRYKQSSADLNSEFFLLLDWLQTAEYKID